MDGGEAVRCGPFVRLHACNPVHAHMDSYFYARSHVYCICVWLFVCDCVVLDASSQFLGEGERVARTSPDMDDVGRPRRFKPAQMLICPAPRVSIGCVGYFLLRTGNRYRLVEVD